MTKNQVHAGQSLSAPCVILLIGSLGALPVINQLKYEKKITLDVYANFSA